MEESSGLDDGPVFLPGNRHGSASTFFHFLLGYFLPIAYRLHTTPAPRIIVQDVGPLGTWFNLLDHSTEVRVLAPQVHADTGSGEASGDDVFRLKGWDVRHAYRQREIAAACSFVRHPRLESIRPADRRITVVTRGRPDPWFEANGQTSGMQRRSLPNTHEVAQALASEGSTGLFEPADLSPAEQVELFSSTNVLVGQHGAGLANMVWMPQGSVVVEVFPPARRIRGYPPSLFEDLAHCLGHAYELVPQSGRHDPVDPEAVRAAVVRAPAGSAETHARELRRRVRGHLLWQALRVEKAVRRLRLQGRLGTG